MVGIKILNGKLAINKVSVSEGFIRFKFSYQGCKDISGVTYTELALLFSPNFSILLGINGSY